MGAVAKFKSRYKAETAELALIGAGDMTPSSAEWINALRNRGRVAVEETGLPTPKLERWKYTNLPARLKKMNLQFAEVDIELSGMTDPVFSFPKDGNFPLWVKEKLEIKPAGHAKYGDMMLWCAANAHLRDGFIVDMPAHATADKPLNVTLTGHDGQATIARQVIRVGEGATLTVIEYQMGSGEYWSNILTQIEIAEGGKLYHYRFQENSDGAAVTMSTHIQMERDATYEAFTVTTGAGLSRNQIHADLLGENCTCHFDGVNLLSGSKQGDTTITIEHQAPGCDSKQNYRSVVTDKATCTFQGKVHVHQVAQKTDGYQLSNALLLSPQATMNTKPELEIYADDVKCSHGATSGRLDAEALFYLRSRGIPEEQARALLIQAFVAEVMEDIGSNEVREQAEHIISRWLAEDVVPAAEDWIAD
jgi:Fe-S cluster assembly protein SufD